MQLTTNEELELRYMQALGYKWIARDNSKYKEVNVYTVKPSRYTSYQGWNGFNGDIGDIQLGEYDFLKWEDEPLEIEKLLRENGRDIPLVEPKGNEL